MEQKLKELEDQLTIIRRATENLNKEAIEFYAPSVVDHTNHLLAEIQTATRLIDEIIKEIK